MDENTKKAVAAITAQQAKVEPDGTVWCCGNQLMDILRMEPAAAAIVAEEIEQKGHGIADCEMKISEYARKNGGACGPRQAERIIREFYGITETAAADQAAIPAPAAAPAQAPAAAKPARRIAFDLFE